jgi:hypothetical protein
MLAACEARQNVNSQLKAKARDYKAESAACLERKDMLRGIALVSLSVCALRFKFRDTKILLISHAHFDHDAGRALIKKETEATYMVMDADVPVVESGGKTDFAYGNSPSMLYPAVKVDRVLHDGDEVKLGGSVLGSDSQSPSGTRSSDTAQKFGLRRSSVLSPRFPTGD